MQLHSNEQNSYFYLKNTFFISLEFLNNPDKSSALSSVYVVEWQNVFAALLA